MHEPITVGYDELCQALNEGVTPQLVDWVPLAERPARMSDLFTRLKTSFHQADVPEARLSAVVDEAHRASLDRYRTEASSPRAVLEEWQEFLAQILDPGPDALSLLKTSPMLHPDFPFDAAVLFCMALTLEASHASDEQKANALVALAGLAPTTRVERLEQLARWEGRSARSPR